MPDDLKSKLTNVLRELAFTGCGAAPDGKPYIDEVAESKAIAAVHQAYTESGYELSANLRRAKLRQQLERCTEDSDKDLMTGQEWFYEFIKATQEQLSESDGKLYEPYDDPSDFYLAAARKAAGLKV